MNAHTYASEEVTLSVRETRMILERILLTTGLPDGFVPAVGNSILYSQAAKLGGLAAFEADVDALSKAKLPTVSILGEDPEGIYVDANGNHAWLVSNDALDLVLARYRTGKSGDLEIRNALVPFELRVMEALAYRHGARVKVTVSADGGTLQVLADGLSEPDAVMDEALRHGFPVPQWLWRSLYDRSGQALTPDSIESRRHAGPVMVDAEGRVHGRDDDDTDFELLRGSRADHPQAREGA